ncbi:hypothetical protein [Paenibacillus elgii]|uniref:hypothetical protein n=1 Tax=Paenibacillus elgii TaxID=189691 RepID=UPI000248E0A9|nr:hypothetical protein [Paenibacillus elgii]
MAVDKIPIIGTITRIEPGKIIVDHGDTVDTYNPKYYRIMPDHESEVQGCSKSNSTS